MIICNDSKQIEEIKSTIDQQMYKLKELSNDIILNIAGLHIHVIEQEKKLRFQNPYIVKSVIKYMANGLNKSDAILLTAKQFNTDPRRVEVVYWGQARYMSAVNLYAKRYTCEKIKATGMTAKNIGKILGVSENHVFKLLRAQPNFWFLEYGKKKKEDA